MGGALAQSTWKAHPSVDDEFRSSALVVVGEVIRTKEVPDPSPVPEPGYNIGTYYTIRITEVLKGNPQKLIRLYSENSSGRFPMKVGVPYLLFAHKEVFEGITGERFAINSSGNSGTVKESAKALVRVRELKETKAQQ